MDQIKIGKFIAECRKNQGMTQMQLAERLNITDRAVSKWETGRAMPDSSIMLELCDVLKINVNDLLSGEITTADSYDKDLENKILELLAQKEKSDKRMILFEQVIAILSLIIFIAPVFAGALLPIEDWQRIIVVFSGFIPGIIGFLFALRIEQVAGYYECKHCKHKYVPTYKEVAMAPHMGSTRYMKCPCCNKKSWQKKVLNND